MEFAGRAGLFFLVMSVLFALFPAVLKAAFPLFLFFLPGYAIICALKMRFMPLEMLSYSVLASILSSTYLIYFISLFLVF